MAIMFEELEKKSLPEIARFLGYFTREKIKKDEELNRFLKNFIEIMKIIREDFDEDYFIEEFAIYDYRIFYIEEEV
ncbi:TPA: hypothetical protein ACNABL_004797 [Escherichia coli]